MGYPQSTGSSGGDGELICRRPHKRRQSGSYLIVIRSDLFYGSVLPEVELPIAATDMTTANTKMIPNACNTILLSSLTVSLFLFPTIHSIYRTGGESHHKTITVKYKMVTKKDGIVIFL